MNIQSLKSDVDFLCGSTSATYPDADKVRNMNVEYHNVARTIWEADGGWVFDDSNNTDAPIATKTMGNLSASYLVPTTAIQIQGVEVKNATGDWSRLKPITYEDFIQSPEEFLTGGGLPLYYMPYGNELRLFPAPQSGYVTLTSGLAVRLARNVTEFAATATTTTPGFAAPFHRILSLAAAIDFIQDPKDREFRMIQKDRLMQGLTTFYSKRNADLQTTIKPAGQRRWRNYL